jgi:hypothetical protein
MNILPPPGPERRRQLVALGLVSVLLVSVFWWQRQPSPPAAVLAGTSKPQPPAAARPAPTESATLPAPLQWAALEQQPASSAVARNPFAFGVRPAPPPPPVSLPPPVASLPAARAPESVGPPAIRLVFTGVVVLPQTGRTMVTLRDPSTGTSFRAFEGDVLDGRYRVMKVSPQAVTVAYVDGTGQRTISLGGG